MLTTGFYTAAFAAILSISSALAGASPRALPSNFGRSDPDYSIRLSARPEAGRPITVAVLNHGRIVKDGRVLLMHPVFVRINKAVPGAEYEAIPLERAADGTFLCAAEHHIAGHQLVLRATLPAGTVWLHTMVRN